MDQYPLRAAIDADVDALLAFWARAAENDSRPADSAEAVRRLIERDPDALVVATIGDRIVGSVIAGWDGWRFHLYRLAVDPALRRHGIGRALLAAAEARLVALGASRIDAMVLDGNDLGQRIWLAAGTTGRTSGAAGSSRSELWLSRTGFNPRGWPRCVPTAVRRSRDRSTPGWAVA